MIHNIVNNPRNIVGPFLFKDSEAPKYPTGIIGCMVSRILEVRLMF